MPRFRNLSDRHPNFIRGYGFEGGGGPRCFPATPRDTPGFGAAYKKEVRDYAGAFISMGGFGEVLPRYENQVELDPAMKDRWGIPVLRFDYRFGDNEKKMCEDMADTAQEMFEPAGFEIVSVDRTVLTEGWSIHELGTARMGTDTKTSVLNQFQQSHDVEATCSSSTAAATSAPRARTRRGRSWRWPGARATTWSASSEREICDGGDETTWPGANRSSGRGGHPGRVAGRRGPLARRRPAIAGRPSSRRRARAGRRAERADHSGRRSFAGRPCRRVAAYIDARLAEAWTGQSGPIGVRA